MVMGKSISYQLFYALKDEFPRSWCMPLVTYMFRVKKNKINKSDVNLCKKY